METESKPDQVPKNLSRRDRRLSEKLANRIEELGATLPVVTPLTPFETVLDQEDNLKFLDREGSKYRSALSLDITTFRLLSIFSHAGFSEEYQRNTFRDIFSNQRSELTAMDTVSKVQVLNSRGLILNLLNIIKRSPVVYRDEDDKDILGMLDQGTDIPVVDLLGEKVRIQQERIDLLELQAAYLREEERRAKKARLKEARKPKKELKKSFNKPEDDRFEQEYVVSQPEVLDNLVEENFALKDWQLFWTTRFFSHETSHLITLPTSSRNDIIELISRVGQGQISVKPQSVLSAVEFHLRKDTIQKALSMRNKFGPEGIKEWIKIKRGDDRIFLFIPDMEEQKLIFFAAGRDIVYRRN